MDDIFLYLANELGKKNTPIDVEEKLAKEFSPQYLIKNGKNSYISFFENELENKIWLIVESLQNVNEKAAEIIINETTRVTKNIHTMLSFQKKFGKIKESVDIEALTYIIAYSMRALIMEYALMKGIKKDTNLVETKIDKVLNQIADFV